jgi:hypothetical protein
MIKAEDGILYAQRIFKNKDYSLEKGDVGWQEDIKYDDITIEYRIFLEDVSTWEEWRGTDADLRYKYKGPLVIIECADGEKYATLCTIREFDEIMRTHRKSLTLQFKHN